MGGGNVGLMTWSSDVLTLGSGSSFELMIQVPRFCWEEQM